MHPSLSIGEADGVPYRVTTRNETRMLVEIETDRVGTWSLCENAIEGPYPRGGDKQVHKQQIWIYSSQWDEVRKLVRTDVHEAAWQDALASAPQQPAIVEKRKAAETALARAKGASSRERAEQQMLDVEHLTAREAIRLLLLKPGFKDGLPPLLSARPIKSNVAPPATPQNLQANQIGDMSRVFAEAFEKMLDRKGPKRE
jgi:hypothetical protein